jgi:hypothetical protein
MIGQKVKDIEISGNGEVVISTQDLVQGLYQFVIHIENIVIAREKIIILK